jgi:SpoVK/Ycf46/Vps4 family AAA+-type ATPase
MNVKLKSVLMILATLIVGVLIGALVLAPWMVRYRIRHLAEMRTPEGFASRLEQVIRPDKVQADEVRAILERHSERFREVSASHRAEMFALMDSLRSDLATVLTAEQLERLKTHDKPFRRPGRFPGRP